MRRMRVAFFAVFLFVAAATAQTYNVVGYGTSFPSPAVTAQLAAFANTTEGKNCNFSYSNGNDGAVPAGVDMLANKSIHFLATDIGLNLQQLTRVEAAAGRRFYHLPQLLTGVVIVYNFPSYTGPALNFTADLVYRLLTAQLLFWNDTALLEANPALVASGLPLARAVQPVARSDSSSTTREITEFLSNYVPTKWTAGAVTTFAWAAGK